MVRYSKYIIMVKDSVNEHKMVFKAASAVEEKEETSHIRTNLGHSSYISRLNYTAPAVKKHVEHQMVPGGC